MFFTLYLVTFFEFRIVTVVHPLKAASHGSTCFGTICFGKLEECARILLLFEFWTFIVPKVPEL